VINGTQVGRGKVVNQIDKEIARCQYVRQSVAPIPPGRNTVLNL
jgi:hypothetical protein